MVWVADDVWEAQKAAKASGKSGGGVQKPQFSKAGTVPCRFFEQGRCNKGDACTFSHDGGSASGAGGGDAAALAKLLGGGGGGGGGGLNALLLQALLGGGGGGGGGGGTSSNQKTVQCKFFEQGRCNKGDACTFLHGGAGGGGGGSWSDKVREAMLRATGKGGGGGGLGGGLAALLGVQGKGKGKGKGGTKCLNDFASELRVWVGGLADDVTWKELQTHFETASGKKSIWVEIIGRPGNHTGAVAYRTAEEANEVIEMVDQSELKGATLTCGAWEQKDSSQASKQAPRPSRTPSTADLLPDFGIGDILAGTS